MSLAAHYWTIRPIVANRLKPPQAPASEPWSATIDDPEIGEVRLTGRLSAAAADRRLAVLVHGLTGSAESANMLRAARAAAGAGLASLRLNLRGADGSGADLYHGGLSGDLHAVLASPELARFEHLYLYGYSLGGHIALRFATEVEEPRLAAVAASCSPLDLSASVAAFDRRGGWIYRRHVLSGLCRLVAAAQEHPRLSLSLAEARRIRTIREWDRHTVVPRFGFASPEDYYRRSSVGHRLERLRRPALLVAARHDPMVSEDAIRGCLNGAPQTLRVIWRERGGHVSFPPDLDLGEAAPPGAEAQIMAWLARQ